MINTRNLQPKSLLQKYPKDSHAAAGIERSRTLCLAMFKSSRGRGSLMERASIPKLPLPPPLQNPLFFSSLPLCRSACEATDKVRGCGGANTCILRPQGMIEAAVSRKNMWLVRVAAVTLGRSGCPSVPFCLHPDPPLSCPGGSGVRMGGTSGVQRTRVDDSPPLNTSSQAELS
ncbi:uncharacterized protein NPIL_128501 [Nephila pilipes]|uniref:Uncharacterized protein n=1 Tax=Nephila pilipes TaxID=299642 RepID=A0A8X6QA75_NEPPI|nr:uncharacterized protein NPIL_128501 [Nephila pilipes]